MKTIDIHGKPYVMVKDRVIHFNGEYPNGCIKTKKLPSIENIVIFEATVIPNIENPDRYFTGHAEEEIGSTQINKTSALENCETSAVGRALAMMGIGADESFASADEVSNAVFQQDGTKSTGITQAHAQSVSQNGRKTPENDLVCPLCSKSVVDKRVWENGEWVRQTSQKGNKFPAFQCIDNDDFKNPTCKGVIWDDPGADLKIEKPSHQNDIVEDDDLEEAEELAKQAEEEVLPF